MAERFLTADLHLSHVGMIKFARADGTPLRPWGRVPTDDDPMSDKEAAERVAAMDEALIERWNRVVGPKDKVEVLGDVVINRRALSLLDRLNGKKRLRSGNHDIFKISDYLRYFEEVSAYKIMDDLVLSHIPIHEDSLKQRWRANIHGHLHDGRVMQHSGKDLLVEADMSPKIHPRYLCVSVEHIDYTPISLDEAYKRIEEQQGIMGATI